MPLSSIQLNRHRAAVAHELERKGLRASDIALVLNLKTKAGRPWKQRARQLAAKGARHERERQVACTCPAQVDITFTGHLPGCPTRS